MTFRTDAILDDLAARSLIHGQTDDAELRAALSAGPITLYCGFDPTADSLHVGNLVPLLLLRRFQEHGHRPIVLAGGATGMIGDPGGRSSERNLLGPAELDANVAAIKQQLVAFLDFEGTDGRPPAILVDNRDWTADVGVLDFLRDVGKHVTVNTMLSRESIKARVEGEHGISFTEFSYMLLQANDYHELWREHGCVLQVGGSDQWGNIVAGVDMVRRRGEASVHALTVPLVTQSDGSKFGKSVDGAVWVDPNKTLPYEFHQHFLRTDDADVERFLLQLTLIEVDEVATIMADHADAPQERRAQRALADAFTTLVHGEAATAQANLAADVLFGGGEITGASLDAVRGIVPESTVATAAATGDVAELLVTTGLAKSKSDARRTLGDNGISVNGEKLDGREALGADDLVDGRFVLLQKGKKNKHLVVIDG